MKIRTKTLTGVGLTMLVLFVMLFGGAYGVLTARYRDMEVREAGTVSARAANALENATKHVDDVAALWAASDDTYRFMETADPETLRREFTEHSLVRHGINFLVVLDTEGRPAHADAVDLDLEVSAEPPPGLVETIERSGFLREPGDPRGVHRGLMELPGGTAVISARSITSSDRYALPRGTLVAGRFVDVSQVTELSDAVGLKLAALPPVIDPPQDAFNTPLKRSAATRATWWEPVNADTMHAYALMDDVRGRPVLLLRAEIPRTARQGLQSAITFAAFALLFICLAATVSVYLLVNWAVISPLSRLSGQVGGIARRGDSSDRIRPVGGGEFDELGERVNGMLASIQAGEMEIKRARDELEERVERRTHELHVSEARHRGLIEGMADAVFSVGLDSLVVSVNERAVEMLGRRRESLLGKRFVDLMTMGSADGVERHLQGVPNHDQSWTVEALLNSVGRDPVPVEIRAAPIIDVDGAIIGTQWIARDITERQRYEARLVHLATHDALTELANRSSFETALELELAEALRSGQGGAVVWFDLDDFKDVNDTLGHAAGDEVLAMLATVLTRNTRASNVVARVGGDEFAVLMPRVTREEAETAAERILSAIVSYTFAVAGRAVRLGASIGVVFFPENGSTVQEVLSNADVAMYRAKDGGRSMVWVSGEDDGAEQLHVSRMTWKERLDTALAEDRFIVYSQPIWDLRTGRAVRHELLIRMVGEGETIYPPSDFLPVAERLGLVNSIDRWMLQRAFMILEANDSELDAVEVNLSGKAFADPDMVKFIAAELERSGVDPKRLGFEITETAAIADMSRAQWFIRSLKDLGCRFSLDDFGTGFSSFYYLKHLPIDCLKIDGSYVRGLSQSEEDRCLVRGICEMCRGLDVEVLAECVEDEAALEVVKSLGLDYAQGFHLGRPAPVVTPWLVEG